MPNKEAGKSAGREFQIQGKQVLVISTLKLLKNSPNINSIYVYMWGVCPKFAHVLENKELYNY